RFRSASTGPYRVIRGKIMKTKTDVHENDSTMTLEVDLSVEELEEVIARGSQVNHNETLVRAEEVDLTLEELEEVIAPGVDLNHNETLVRAEDLERIFA